MTEPVEVTDEALGRALDKLVYQGTQRSSSDGGVCLVTAVRTAGLSDEALVYLTETGSDDLGAIIDRLREVSEDDAAILLSPRLREDFDTCVDQDLLPDGSGHQTYESPNPAEAPVADEPNLKPRYDIGEDEQITSAAQLTDGLVSMFSSYALDENQKEIYAAAGPCLSGAVLDAGFTQKTLRFLAGGAPVGTGSVADHLPGNEDEAIWESAEFTTSLVDCTNVTPDLPPEAGS
ncbi:hypothetical protein [Promicromonospora aerolata]|uniref:DUF732 domain-containing protein n=1 Tax=Promicromonospora aerolata TaxID=195749 RepID=A0ABW4V3U1_9MICO